MPLHHTRDGYNFNADAHARSIEPGPKPITLTRWELERIGLIFQKAVEENAYVEDKQTISS